MLTLPLLRSILRADDADAERTLADNLTMLWGELRPEGIDGPIVGYVWSVYDRSRTVINLTALKAHFDRQLQVGHPEGMPALQRLDALVPMPALLDPASFRAELDAYKEAVLQQKTTAVMMEAATILKVGLQSKVRGQTVTLKGTAAAVERLQSGVQALGALFRSRQSSSDLASDTDAIRQAYAKAKANPGAQFGVLSGLGCIDRVHGGIKPGEMALVLGYVNHMKSTFCMNWAYKNSVIYHKSSAILSLETSVERLRIQLAVLHTQHPTFFDPNIPAITVQAVEMGQLTPPQEKVYDAALDDLKTNATYGPLHYRGADKADISMTDVNAWVSEITRHTDLDLLVIDYIGLISPGDERLKAKGNALSEFANLNVTLREGKLLAGSANHGRGTALLSPFQSNREGVKDAEKNGGRYTLRALSGANEAERSSDYVYYVYLDDALRASKELAFGNLKARNAPVILDQFRLYADGETRLIDDASMAAPTASPI